MKKIFLVPKIGNGSQQLFSVKFSDEIIVAQIETLKHNIQVNSSVAQQNEKYEYTKFFNQGDEMVLINGVYKDLLSQFRNDYLVFDNKEDALHKHSELLDKIKESMIEHALQHVNQLIDSAQLKAEASVAYSHKIVD